MFLLNEVVACPERHQVCVVRRRWDGNGARAAYVCVTQLIGQHLNLISAEMIVIPQHVVVRRTTRALHCITNDAGHGCVTLHTAFVNHTVLYKEYIMLFSPSFFLTFYLLVQCGSLR